MKVRLSNLDIVIINNKIFIKDAYKIKSKKKMNSIIKRINFMFFYQNVMQEKEEQKIIKKWSMYSFLYKKSKFYRKIKKNIFTFQIKQEEKNNGRK